MKSKRSIAARSVFCPKHLYTFIFFVGFAGFSQSDTTYLTNYTDKIILKLNVDTQNNSIYYRNREDNSKLNLATNNQYHLFLSIDYEFIGASIGVGPKFLGHDLKSDLKGESSFTDYRFRMFLGKWVQSLQYSKVSGYYVENTSDFIPGWVEGEDPYLQFNGLSNSFYGMSTAYVFNPKFSYRNIVYQTEWQRKSSGSLITTLKYDYSILELDENDINEKEKYFTVTLSPAYYYTHVIRENWFISANISPSFGYRFTKYESNIESNEDEKTDYSIKNINGGLNLGYSSERVIFGLNMTLSADWYNSDSSSAVENDQFYGVIYVGYRFDPPKAIDKIFHPNR